MSSRIRKASKARAKLRAALFGPAGSGKTMSALRIAHGLARGGGRVGLIDSERESASKYSDRWPFDEIVLEHKAIPDYVEAINEFAAAGYEVLVIDSLSHAWQELLEEIDRLTATKFRGNSWSAWSEGTPKQKELVGAILNYPGHVIATMRAKTVWETEEKNGRKTITRLGAGVEQGKGIEYEFDFLVEISTDHVAQVLKDRSGKFQDKTFKLLTEDFGADLGAWLEEGTDPARAPRPAATQPQEQAQDQEQEETWSEFARSIVGEFNKAWAREQEEADWPEVTELCNVHALAQHIAKVAISKGLKAPAKKTTKWSHGIAERLWKKRAESVRTECRAYLKEELKKKRHELGFGGDDDPIAVEADEPKPMPEAKTPAEAPPGVDPEAPLNKAELIQWCKTIEENCNLRPMPFIAQIGKSNKWGAMDKWSAEQIIQAYHAAGKWIDETQRRRLRAKKEARDEALEEAISN